MCTWSMGAELIIYVCRVSRTREALAEEQPQDPS